jgi:hypothetical protein
VDGKAELPGSSREVKVELEQSHPVISDPSPLAPSAPARTFWENGVQYAIVPVPPGDTISEQRQQEPVELPQQERLS